MKRFLVLLFAAIIIFGSCSRYKEIQINDADIVKVEMVSMSRYHITLAVEVDNPSGLTFSIMDVAGSVYKNGEKFADITVDKPMKIRARSTEDVTMECTIAVADPLSLLAVGLSYKNMDLSQFTLNMEGSIKWANVTKTVKLENLSLQDLFTTYVEKNK